MLRSLRTSLQTQPKATRSGAEGSKGLGGQEGVTLVFFKCCFVPLLHFPAFLPFCLQFFLRVGVILLALLEKLNQGPTVCSGNTNASWV